MGGVFCLWELSSPDQPEGDFDGRVHRGQDGGIGLPAVVVFATGPGMSEMMEPSTCAANKPSRIREPV